MSSDLAYICATGMLTAVGDDTISTASAVRAGINRYRKSIVYNDRFDSEILSLVPDECLSPLSSKLDSITSMTSRQVRMLRLATPAINAALVKFPKDRPIALFLSLPETIPNLPVPATDAFLDHLILQSEANIDRSKSSVYPYGRAGGMMALEAAMQALESETHDFALVGGVDTYLDLMLLSTLDADKRVAAHDVMDTFTPGEGAGFLLLASQRVRQYLGRGIFSMIAKPGLASEKGHRYSDEPYLGDGLAEAFALSLEDQQPIPIKTIYASFNGENFGAKEYSVACTRNSDKIDTDVKIEHPADCFGDIGAAFAPVMLGLASIGLYKNYIKGPVLAFCASEGEHRGAACIQLES